VCPLAASDGATLRMAELGATAAEAYRLPV
jgi:hypothetical protein